MRSRPLAAKTRGKGGEGIPAWAHSIAQWLKRNGMEYCKTKNINIEKRKVTTMMQVIRQFVKEEEGLAAAEYALLLTLIAVALITAITAFKNAIAAAFNSATANLS